MSSVDSWSLSVVIMLQLISADVLRVTWWKLLLLKNYRTSCWGFSKANLNKGTNVWPWFHCVMVRFRSAKLQTQDTQHLAGDTEGRGLLQEAESALSLFVNSLSLASEVSTRIFINPQLSSRLISRWGDWAHIMPQSSSQYVPCSLALVWSLPLPFHLTGEGRQAGCLSSLL